jgi:hypothetical protein
MDLLADPLTCEAPGSRIYLGSLSFLAEQNGQSDQIIGIVLIYLALIANYISTE